MTVIPTSIFKKEIRSDFFVSENDFDHFYKFKESVDAKLLNESDRQILIKILKREFEVGF